MSDNEIASVRGIDSGKPFQRAALKYAAAGWFPFPLKPGLKVPWANGVTGRKNDFPDDEQAAISQWLAECPERCNIGLWMREDVIGIDVDNYDDKEGGKTFADLQRRLGKLPATWISSARGDGVSGIRFFRIPKKWVGKLSWSGKAGEGIDIVQRTHRYAGVWPSYNPDAGAEYRWYPPGQEPDGNPDRFYSMRRVGKQIKFGDLVELPNVDDLPELPEPWVEYLTRGYIEHTNRAIDMEATGQEIEAWAKKHFRRAYNTDEGYKLCRELQKRYDNALESTVNSATAHDKLVDAHWSLLSCGIEGHAGVMRAVRMFERRWLKHAVKELQKRSLDSAQGEVFRSRMEALRKLKGKADEMIKAGGSPFRTLCGCPDPTVPLDVPAEGGVIPTGQAQDPDRYERTDAGNARHLMDLFHGDLMWIPAYGAWMFWNGSRWIRDDDYLSWRCWQMVQKRQRSFALSLMNKASEVLDAKGAEDPEYKKAKAKAKMWSEWADKSGDNSRTENALKSARSIEGVTVQADLLDTNHRLLGVANGIIELRDDGFLLREAQKKDYVTLNTGVPFLHDDDIKRAGGDIAAGRELWNNYLNIFVPDLELRHFVQKVMGYCLLGVNSKRLGVFLIGPTTSGKSTMLSSVLAALGGAGGYASTVDLSLFKESPGGGANPQLLQALPRRVVTASEAGMARFSAEVFKNITGNDLKSARGLYSNTFIERKPAFVPVIATNSPPKMDGADAAVKRRVLPIPFKRQVSDKLEKETAGDDIALYGREAVLNWLVNGWVAYALEGLSPKEWPTCVKQEIDEFMGGLNHELAFMHECITRLDPDPEKSKVEQSVRVDDAFDAYQQWIINIGGDPKKALDKPEWRAVMRANGINEGPLTHTKEDQALFGRRQGRYFHYISLKNVVGNVTKFDSRKA